MREETVEHGGKRKEGWRDEWKRHPLDGTVVWWILFLPPLCIPSFSPPFSRSHVVSSTPPSNSLTPSFYLPPLLFLSLVPSFCAQRVWWSQLYSWELNTQNCSVPWIEARCLRNPESLSKDSLCLFNWLPPLPKHTHIHTHTWMHLFMLKNLHSHKLSLQVVWMKHLSWSISLAAERWKTEDDECINNTH